MMGETALGNSASWLAKTDAVFSAGHYRVSAVSRKSLILKDESTTPPWLPRACGHFQVRQEQPA